MADLPRTRSFKLTVAMDEWLAGLAREEQRKVGDMIRILLGRLMAVEDDGRGDDDRDG